LLVSICCSLAHNTLFGKLVVVGLGFRWFSSDGEYGCSGRVIAGNGTDIAADSGEFDLDDFALGII
jgi:hypothetical protein